MPIYRIRCNCCGTEQDIFRTLSTYNDLPAHCGETMTRVICAPAIHADLPGYESPATGKWIEGRAARRDDLARSGCRPWEGLEAERKEAAKVKDEHFAKSDAFIEHAVSQAAQQIGL